MIAHILMAAAVAATTPPSAWTTSETATGVSASLKSADGQSRLTVRCDTGGDDPILSLQFIPDKSVGYSSGHVSFKIQQDGNAMDMPVPLRWEQAAQGAFAKDETGYDRIGTVSQMLIGGKAKIVMVAANAAGMPLVQTFDTDGGDPSGTIARVMKRCGGEKTVMDPEAYLGRFPATPWVFDSVKIDGVNVQRATLTSMDRVARIRFLCRYDADWTTAMEFEPAYGLTAGSSISVQYDGVKEPFNFKWQVGAHTATLTNEDLVGQIAYTDASTPINATYSYTTASGAPATARFMGSDTTAISQVYTLCNIPLGAYGN